MTEPLRNWCIVIIAFFATLILYAFLLFGGSKETQIIMMEIEIQDLYDDNQRLREDVERLMGKLK